MAGKLKMLTTPEKALVNNSGERTVGIELFLREISREEPFVSLFPIQEAVLQAIMDDMGANGFDPSKPVNVWKRPDGSRVLVDGYTRFQVALNLGLARVTASERIFADEEEALAYAIHTQKDRRNLDDATLLGLVRRIDRRQEGKRIQLAPRGANWNGPPKSAEITAAALDVSTRQVERCRTVLEDSEATEAVLAGTKSIAQASKAAAGRRKAVTHEGEKSPSAKSAKLTVKIAAEAKERLGTLWKELNLTEEQGLLRALDEFAKAHGVILQD